MGNGKIRKMFPGSNSAYGFFSHYDQIVGSKANRIFIFKGGPGVGKSSFMKNIGKELALQGYDLEYHYCSSDNESLDALYIPEKKIALMDGTFPHVIDPKYPGAVDEIINLGEYWEAAKIREQREKIIELQTEITWSFQQAYRLIATAKICRDAAESCLQAVDNAALLSLAEDLTGKILAGQKKAPSLKKSRRLFASAITPGGTVNYLETLVDDLSYVYILNGENTAAKRTIISKILDALTLRGFYVEIFSCALDPKNIDHLIVRELDAAVINSTWPHNYTGQGAGSQEIGTELLEAKIFSAASTKDLEELRSSFENALHKGVLFLKRAKLLHDELEKLYIPHMKFERIESLKKQVLESILS